MNKAAQAYFQTKVNTTDQGQLLLLLYDGALRFLQQAREKMLVKDYAAKGIFISKVIDILNELTNTLNLEKGGTLAENLNNLYFLCTTRLLQANLKMNVEQLDNVTTILTGLRSAYAEIIETPEAKKASAQISAKLNVDASVNQRAPVQTQNNSMPTSIGRMQARNAYGAAKSAPAMNQNTDAQTSVSNPVITNTMPVNAAMSINANAQMTAEPVKPTETPAMDTVNPAFKSQLSEAMNANSTASSENIQKVIPQEPNPKASAIPFTADTPQVNAATPKKGFGVSGFAYTKAFGK